MAKQHFLYLVLFLYSLPLIAKNISVDHIEKLRHGLNKKEVEKILGAPNKEKNNTWIYGDEKKPSLKIYWDKKKTIEKAESFEIFPILAPTKIVQELSQMQDDGDATPATRYFAEAEKGNIWEINHAGRITNFLVVKPWTPQKPGSEFKKLFSPPQQKKDRK